MNKKELNKITKFLENNDFGVSSNTKQGNEYVIEFGQYTPLGEDWYVCVFYDGTFNNFKDKVTECYENFDVDEEVEGWVEHRGKNGVPSSIKDLIEDAEWKEEQLKELSENL